jgi:hypothetical protein
MYSKFVVASVMMLAVGACSPGPAGPPGATGNTGNTGPTGESGTPPR